VGEQTVRDALDLFFGLGGSVDHFRRSLTHFAVMIDLGVSEILKRSQL